MDLNKVFPKRGPAGTGFPGPQKDPGAKVCFGAGVVMCIVL